MIQRSFRGIDLRLERVRRKALAAGVQFSAARRLETLTSAGFEVAVEQVSMSFGGHALPGKRDLYLALMHPTLG